jgi:spore coat polysaccharide biosynthesis protein SpsF
VLPQFVDACIERLQADDVAYVSEGSKRTFPLGTSCEAFTTESFERVRTVSSSPQQREHVTLAYKHQAAEFETASITSEEFFDQEWLQNRTDLRLTLDEPADYKLFRTVYEEVPYRTHLDTREAIRYIDENELWKVNEHVTQKIV